MTTIDTLTVYNPENNNSLQRTVAVSNSENNNILERVRAELGIPDNITDEALNQKKDFLTLYFQTTQQLQRNTAAPKGILYKHERKNLPEEDWKEDIVFEQINKISLYNDVIQDIKNETNNNLPNLHLIKLEEVSKNVTVALLKTLRLIDGDTGDNEKQFLDTLNLIQSNSCTRTDCLRVNNFLLYATPFAIACAPEFISYNQVAHAIIELYGNGTSYAEITWIMKVQANLEASIPSLPIMGDLIPNNFPIIGSLRSVYFMYSHRYQYLKIIALTLTPKFTNIIFSMFGGNNQRSLTYMSNSDLALGPAPVSDQSSGNSQSVLRVNQDVIDYTDPIIMAHLSP